jgi:hypothetical protein
MPMINGRFSATGNYSPYQSLQIERARMTAARQQAESDSAVLTSALGDVSVQLSQGLADLAAQQALARLNAAVSAQQDPSATAADTSDDPVDPLTAVDEAMNGIDDLISATDQQTDGTDTASLIDDIISGTDGLATSDTGTTGDVISDSDLFSQIDSMINSFVPPLPPSVDITA